MKQIDCIQGMFLHTQSFVIYSLFVSLLFVSLFIGWYIYMSQANIRLLKLARLHRCYAILFELYYIITDIDLTLQLLYSCTI